jgi:hypothetical protein
LTRQFFSCFKRSSSFSPSLSLCLSRPPLPLLANLTHSHPAPSASQITHVEVCYFSFLGFWIGFFFPNFLFAIYEKLISFFLFFNWTQWGQNYVRFLSNQTPRKALSKTHFSIFSNFPALLPFSFYKNGISFPRLFLCKCKAFIDVICVLFFFFLGLWGIERFSLIHILIN